MEGPSLYLAARQLKPFRGKTVLSVSGNTKIEKERILDKKLKPFFPGGNTLLSSSMNLLFARTFYYLEHLKQTLMTPL